MPSLNVRNWYCLSSSYTWNGRECSQGSSFASVYSNCRLSPFYTDFPASYFIGVVLCPEHVAIPYLRARNRLDKINIQPLVENISKRWRNTEKSWLELFFTSFLLVLSGALSFLTQRLDYPSCLSASRCQKAKRKRENVAGVCFMWYIDCYIKLFTEDLSIWIWLR